MFTLIFSEQFDKNFSKIKDKKVKKRIWKKILQLETQAPLGKKLKGNPFWSIHIGRFRVIYSMDQPEIVIADVLERKKSYRELK